MKILVTGGGGFIGRVLVFELKSQGHNVYTLSNSGHPDIKANVSNHKSMVSIVPDFDIVYHLAGVLGTSELNRQAYEAAKINILGTVNILDGAMVNKTKVVHITKPNVWLNTYSITKTAAEDFCKMYHQEFGLPVVSAKWYNVYGPGQSFHVQKAVPYFIRWALANEDIQIWGDGEQTMDLIHVKDAVGGLIAVANEQSFEGQTVDVGSGKEVSVNGLANMIIELTGSKSKIVHLPMRAGEVANTHLAANITALVPYFKCQVDLQSGMGETIAWYKENP